MHNSMSFDLTWTGFLQRSIENKQTFCDAAHAGLEHSNTLWLRLARLRNIQPRVPFLSTQPVPIKSEGLLLFNPDGVI